MTEITINSIRSIKSSNELKYIRKAALLANESIKICIKNIQEGITTAEIASKIIQYQISNNGTYTAISPMIMVNEKSGHMNWTNDKLQKGQIVLIEMAAAHLYYHCPISRTVFIGNSNDLKNSDYKDIYTIANGIHEAISEILEHIKPGIGCKYIIQIFNRIINNSNGIGIIYYFRYIIF